MRAPDPAGCCPAHLNETLPTGVINQMRILLILGAMTVMSCAGAADVGWTTWPPRDYLLKSLVERVEGVLNTQDLETGRFGTQPWICTDQNVLFPLAVAWATEDEGNPWYHSDRVLQAIAKGGEALVDDQDDKGMWIFRKKDNSTWGQIHMPWTYSRWIRAYYLIKDALPAASREKWDKGLLLGFNGIRRYADGGVHNIPTHHAMALYIAGVCFDNEDWRQAAAKFMAKVVDKQDPAGYWSEHFGPVVGYNAVYVEALGIYYQFSKDPVVLQALARSADFHSKALWPDGSPVSAIDERQIYHSGVSIGNVGFSWTDAGRGYLLKQVAAYSDGGVKATNAEYAASMLLHSGEGTGTPPPGDTASSRVTIGDGGALIQREKPWQWCLSAYACKPPNNRWIQDRHNLIDIYHDAMGLVIGGGNTKLQPYWSTFTVGDPALLRHTPGDESPQFVPEVDLLWTPDEGSLDVSGDAPVLNLKYGQVDCSAGASVCEDGSLALTFRAPADKQVEAHLPLLNRSGVLKLANGQKLALDDADLRLDHEQIGDSFTWRGCRVSVPRGASLMWPAWQHNPYAKDGHSNLSSAKLVLCLPFSNGVTEHTIIISHETPPPFEGLVFEARDIPFRSDTGTRTKRLDGLGSQFLGATKPGQSITFTLPQVEAGTYELSGEFVIAYVYGIVRVLVDGSRWANPSTPMVRAWMPMGSVFCLGRCGSPRVTTR